MRSATNLARALCLLLLVAATAYPDAMPSGIEHVGLSACDRLLLCAREVFRAPVLLDEASPCPDSSVACPAPKAALVESLKTEGLLTFEVDGWVHLTSARWFTAGPHASVEWKQLQVTQTTKQWDRPEARKLSESETDQISKAILEQARPPLVYTPRGRRGGRIDDTLEMLLYLDAWILDSKRETQSILGVWGVENGVRRLVYGELSGGTYRPLWDSPLLPGMWLEIGYPDVDGDGVREIVVQAVVSTSGRSTAVVVFDIRGHEISRQPENKDNCWWMDGRTGPGISCPITGQRDEGIEFVQRKDGKTDIVAYASGRPIRYRLVNHRYVGQAPTAR